MLNAIRLLRYQPQQPCVFPTPWPPYKNTPSQSISSLKFRQAATTNATNHQPQEEDQEDNMEPSQTNNRNNKTGDVMSHSFGEGYATRSDEEGFGGIYGGNDSFPHGVDEKEKDGKIHENHPEYDKSQGSEVAEKEKARHQKTAEC